MVRLIGSVAIYVNTLVINGSWQFEAERVLQLDTSAGSFVITYKIKVSLLPMFPLKVKQNRY